jgi:hypothetical protein
VVQFRDDLGRHVGRGAAESVNGTGRQWLQTESEINEAQLLIAIEKNVFSLDIPVDDVALVQVFDGLRNGAEELFGLLLLKAMLWFG